MKLETLIHLSEVLSYSNCKMAKANLSNQGSAFQNSKTVGEIRSRHCDTVYP